MPITLTCPNCASKLRGPGKARGRSVPCPMCSQTFVVADSLITDDDSTIPLAPIRGRSAPAPNLITCAACGQKIAPAAKCCPGCGNPNTYVHPEIQRFIKSTNSFQSMPQFNYKVDGFILSGWADVQKGALGAGNKGSKLIMASLLMGLFGAGIPLLLPIAGLLLLVGIVMSSSVVFSGIQPSDYVTRFSIDFNQMPPAWQSDDDAFWKDVKAFFPGAVGPRP